MLPTFQVFHRLVNKTNPIIFKIIEVDSIVICRFVADPNYGNLAAGNYCLKCIGKVDWNYPDYKFVFTPVNDAKVKQISVIANTKTGEVFTCEIIDHGYVHLEIRGEKSSYSHSTTNCEVPVEFLKL